MAKQPLMSDDYSRGFNKARELDRAAVREYLIDQIDTDEWQFEDEENRIELLESAIADIDQWLDRNLPLEEELEEDED